MLSRYLGGHSTSRDQEGCNWLVLCVCKDCKDKPVEYTENGGRVMTMEEFFEHGTGPQGSVDCNAWRTVVYVHVTDANGEKVIPVHGRPLLLPPSSLEADTNTKCPPTVFGATGLPTTNLKLAVHGAYK